MPDQVSTDQQEFDTGFAEAVAQRAADEAPKESTTAAPAAPAAETSAPAKPAATTDNPPGDRAASASAPAKPGAARPGDADPIDERLVQALHRERSSANRISAFATENNRLKAALAERDRELSALRAKPASPVSAPTRAEDVLGQAPDLEASIQARIADALRPHQEALESAQRRLSEVDGMARQAAESVQPLSEAEERRQITNVMSQLDNTFSPAWRKDIKTADFVSWLNAQDSIVQDRYENATTFGASSTVLQMYYANKGITRRPVAQGAASAQATPPQAADRLRRASGIAPRSSATLSTKPEDFDGAFAEFTAARQQQRTQVAPNAQHLR